jgi:SAM-dependent MidA family methyltransferase
MSFPEPSNTAQAHSFKLQQQIKTAIAQQGKTSFHDYMQRALYTPGLGYYSAGAHKFGESGDFITAPEISPLFGMTIAQSLKPYLEAMPQSNWLELGAGTGKLAESVLNYLAKEKNLPSNYFILEVSADLKQRQHDYLQAQLTHEIFKRIIWLDRLPESFTGIIIANEVLDALPVHRFKITEDGAKEIYVSYQNNFHEILDTPSSVYLAQRLNALTLPKTQGGMDLALGYESEINLQQEALLKALNKSLTQGIMLFIDYGFPAREFYHPDRDTGTLMCHYQHHAHPDPYFWPGLQDITAHIDFTALAKCGIEEGLILETFTTQASLLMHGGIVVLAQNFLAQEKNLLLTTNAIRKLISPEEMGELFKVILFSKNLHIALPQLESADQRHRL